MPDTGMDTKMSKTKACSYEGSLLNIGRDGLRIVQKRKPNISIKVKVVL